MHIRRTSALQTVPERNPGLRSRGASPCRRRRCAMSAPLRPLLPTWAVTLRQLHAHVRPDRATTALPWHHLRHWSRGRRAHGVLETRRRHRATGARPAPVAQSRGRRGWYRRACQTEAASMARPPAHTRIQGTLRACVRVCVCAGGGGGEQTTTVHTCCRSRASQSKPWNQACPATCSAACASGAKEPPSAATDSSGTPPNRAAGSRASSPRSRSASDASAAMYVGSLSLPC